MLTITRPAGKTTGFILQTKEATSAAGRSSSEMQCDVVIVATGLQKAHIPSSVHGIEHAIGYEDLPPTGESFEGQSVAVLGMGNAAMETADACSSFPFSFRLVSPLNSQLIHVLFLLLSGSNFGFVLSLSCMSALEV